MDGKLKSKSGIWILMALTAASVEPIMVKLGYQAGASTLQLLVYRNLIAAAAMLLITRKGLWIGWDKLWQIARVSWLLLATNGLVMYSLNHMSAVAVITVVTTTPAFVALVNQWRGRDLLGFEFWLGFSACFCGVSLTIGAVDFKGSGLQDLHNFHLLSLLALMGAVATSTTYRAQLDLLTQKIPPLEISTTIFVINGFLSSVLILPWVDPMPGGAFRLVLWMGIAAALANVAFLSAIKLIGSTRMSIFDMIQRPLVIVGAALALKEPLGPLQILGIALVLGGVRLAKVKRRVEQQPLRELRG